MKEECQIKEDFSLINGKLCFLFALNLLGGIATVLGLLYPFQQVKWWVGACAIPYSIIINLYNFYNYWYPSGIFFRGQRDGKVIQVESKLVLPEAIYQVRVLEGQRELAKGSWGVGEWIEEEGYVSGLAMHNALNAFTRSWLSKHFK